MKNKIIILVVAWLLYIFSDYYILPYFVRPFSWLVVCLILIILSVRQVKKCFKEKRHLKQNRLLNTSITIIIFTLTFYNFNRIPESLIEKFDWMVSYNKRNEIVREIIKKPLTQNKITKNGIYELPFKFPIVSNGGNDVWIYGNKNSKTIKFWISRGFFEGPQKYFIFTNDNETKVHYQKLINSRPKENWKLEENWYRIMERD